MPIFKNKKFWLKASLFLAVPMAVFGAGCAILVSAWGASVMTAFAAAGAALLGAPVGMTALLAWELTAPDKKNISDKNNEGKPGPAAETSAPTNELGQKFIASSFANAHHGPTSVSEKRGVAPYKFG